MYVIILVNSWGEEIPRVMWLNHGDVGAAFYESFGLGGYHLMMSLGGVAIRWW